MQLAHLTLYLLIAVNFGIFLQDWKSREVSLWLLLLAGALAGYTGSASNGFSIWYKDSAKNIGILAAQLMLAFGYFSFRAREWVPFINRYLGMGDILYWLVLCILLSFDKYIWIMPVSLGFSLLVWFAVSPFSKNRKMVPLAGLQAIFMALLTLLHATGLYTAIL